jgi:hypothetical protein
MQSYGPPEHDFNPGRIYVGRLSTRVGPREVVRAVFLRALTNPMLTTFRVRGARAGGQI